MYGRIPLDTQRSDPSGLRDDNIWSVHIRKWEHSAVRHSIAIVSKRCDHRSGSMFRMRPFFGVLWRYDTTSDKTDTSGGLGDANDTSATHGRSGM